MGEKYTKNKRYILYLIVMAFSALLSIFVYFINFDKQGKRFTSAYESSLLVGGISNFSIYLSLFHGFIILLSIFMLFYIYFKFKKNRLFYLVPIYYLIWNLLWIVIYPLVLSFVVFRYEGGLILYDSILNFSYDYGVIFSIVQLFLSLYIIQKIKGK